MARKMDPTLKKILSDYGFGQEACWDCHGTWVIYHWALEQIAAKAAINFDLPMPLETNGEAKSVALCVMGRLNDKAEWSVGEASPANNKNSYPYAMAEKRAKDRVILKLIGLHGLAYSSEEADFEAQASGKSDRPERGAKDSSGQWTRHSVKQDMRAFLKEINDCGDYDEFLGVMAGHKALMQACSELAPDWWREADPDYPDAPPFRQVIEERKQKLYDEARRKAEYEPAQ